jgi:hypothetical protein
MPPCSRYSPAKALQSFSSTRSWGYSITRRESVGPTLVWPTNPVLRRSGDLNHTAKMTVAYRANSRPVAVIPVGFARQRPRQPVSQTHG